MCTKHAPQSSHSGMRLFGQRMHVSADISCERWSDYLCMKTCVTDLDLLQMYLREDISCPLRCRASLRESFLSASMLILDAKWLTRFALIKKDHSDKSNVYVCAYVCMCAVWVRFDARTRDRQTHEDALRFRTQPCMYWHQKWWLTNHGMFAAGGCMRSASTKSMVGPSRMTSTWRSSSSPPSWLLRYGTAESMPQKPKVA